MSTIIFSLATLESSQLSISRVRSKALIEKSMITRPRNRVTALLLLHQYLFLSPGLYHDMEAPRGGQVGQAVNTQLNLNLYLSAIHLQCRHRQLLPLQFHQTHLQDPTALSERALIHKRPMSSPSVLSSLRSSHSFSSVLLEISLPTAPQRTRPQAEVVDFLMLHSTRISLR